MSKTNFVKGATPGQSTLIDADFMNSIFNTNGGHKHDGGTDDGSAAKVDADHINGLSGSGAVNLDKIPDGTTRKAVDTSQTADDITHAQTTKKLSYTGSHIMLDNSGSYIAQRASQTMAITPAAADGNFYFGYLPLVLPDGAVLDELHIYGGTGTGGNVQVKIFRIELDTGTTYQVGGTISVGPSGNFPASLTGISHQIVNNSYAYVVEMAVMVAPTYPITNAVIYGAKTYHKTTNLKQT